MKIVFAGTPEFAVPALKALIAANHVILAVYTQPDRPAGRGRQLKASPIKQYAKAAGLTIRQPKDLHNEIQELEALQPDVMIVVAYGLLLPPAVLRIPKFGCLNIHASLLPRWRGAAPIQRAIEAGDSATGITIMQMDEGLDTGDIRLQGETSIEGDDTAQSLHDRLAYLGAELLIKALDRLEQGTLETRPQDENQACYAQKLAKSEGKLDWNKPAETLLRKIRAFNPWPVAHSKLRGKSIRIWEAEILPNSIRARANKLAPGTIVATDKNGLTVQTGDSVIALNKLQPEGGRPMDAQAFINGFQPKPGERLG